MLSSVRTSLGVVLAGILASGSLAAPVAAGAPEAQTVASAAGAGVQSNQADWSPSYQVQPLAVPKGLPVGAQVAVAELNDRGVALVQVTNATSPGRACYLASSRSASWLSPPVSNAVGGKVTGLRCHDVAINGTVVGSAEVDRHRSAPVAWVGGRSPVTLRVRPGSVNVHATAVNTSGTSFYGYRGAFENPAFLIWNTRGSLTREVPLPVDTETFTVTDASDNETVVGWVYGGLGSGSPLAMHQGRVTWLKGIGGMDQPEAISPNGRVIVGIANSVDEMSSWNEGAFYRLGAAGQRIPAPTFLPNDTNNARRLAGTIARSEAVKEPGVWVGGRSYALNKVTQPARMKITAAGAINERGDIGAVADLG